MAKHSQREIRSIRVRALTETHLQLSPGHPSQSQGLWQLLKEPSPIPHAPTQPEELEDRRPGGMQRSYCRMACLLGPPPRPGA